MTLGPAPQWFTWWHPDLDEDGQPPEIDYDQFRARLQALGWYHVAARTPRPAWLRRFARKVRT
jgi:hypothetical protein